MRAFFLIIVFAAVCLFPVPDTAGCGKPAVKKKTGMRFTGENFNFEKPGLTGWSVSGPGFRGELDRDTAAAGKQSLRLFYKADAPDLGLNPLGVVSAQLPAAFFRDKRLRLSAALKTRDAGTSFLWVRADAGKGNPVAFTRLPYRECPKGTGDWQRYSIEIDIPADTTALLIGAACYGKGAVWVDDFVVETPAQRGPVSLTLGGKVVDEQGKPVAGALVSVNNFYRETGLTHTSSDDKGDFIFYLPPGFYYITATAPGLTAGSVASPRIYEKDVTNLVIRLRGDGFTIKGKIETAGALLPADSFVLLNRLNFIGAEVFCVRPEPDGGFQVKVPTGNGYKVYLDACDSHLISGPVMVGATDKKTCVLKAFAAKPAPVEVVKWMKRQAIPLRTVEAGRDITDLLPLKKIIGSARVVGLGETSHGTREIFQMKHRLFEFLVKEMGFTVFAMECHWPESMAVNEYVLHGKGDPLKALAGLNAPWNCESVLALIHWMRAYNDDPVHGKKLKFFGVDIHSSGAAHVARYLKKVDPGFLNQGEWPKFLSKLEKSAPFGYLYRSPEQESYTLPAKLNDLLRRFDNYKERYTAASSLAEWRVNRQHVRNLEQIADYAIAARVSDYAAFDIRDRAMADNVRWILDHEPAETKVVYWGHNFHVGLTKYPGWQAKSMGMYLRRLLGNDYLAVGFAFDRGVFRSRDSTVDSLKTRGAERCFTIASYPGSIGAAMARTGIPVFALDLRSIPASASGEVGRVQEWFEAPHILKSIDSVFADEQDIRHLFRLPRLFDAVIFFENTTATRPVFLTPLPVTLF
jgi:erythromycin esterase